MGFHGDTSGKKGGDGTTRPLGESTDEGSSNGKNQTDTQEWVQTCLQNLVGHGGFEAYIGNIPC